MTLNIRDKTIRHLLSFAKAPLLFYPYYRYHLPLPGVILIENTNCCNAQCVMCPRETLSRKPGFMEIWNGPVLSAIRSNFGKLDYRGFPTCLRCDWVIRR